MKTFFCVIGIFCVFGWFFGPTQRHYPNTIKSYGIDKEGQFSISVYDKVSNKWLCTVSFSRNEAESMIEFFDLIKDQVKTKEDVKITKDGGMMQ